MDDKLCLLICEHFEAEARAVIALEQFPDVEMAFYPGMCGHPLLAWHDLAPKIRACGMCNQIDVVGGYCLSGLGSPPAALSHCVLNRSAQCFYRVLNATLVDSYLDAHAYLITPSWLAHWQAHIAEWGFDIAQAREFFAESAEHLVLLDTGVDPRSAQYLREFSEFVALPYESVPVGLEFFRLFLTHLVLSWRLTHPESDIGQSPSPGLHQAADYAMVLDLIGMLTQLLSESEAIDNIFNLFTALFAPAVLSYAPWVENELGDVRITSSSPKSRAEIEMCMWTFDIQQPWQELDEGFVLRLSHGVQILGVLVVDELAFPEHKTHYLNLALSVADVCGLAINNARTYRRIRQAEHQLREYNERLEDLVTEKVQELELERAKSLQAAKLASIGEMATGVAHELNQPLTAMLFDADYLKLLIQKMKHDPENAPNFDADEVYEISQNFVRDIDRCRRIIDHLRDFGRASSSLPTLLDLNQVIQQSLILTEARLRQHDIDVRLDLDTDLPFIRANANKIEQVFLNMLSNAEYALAQRADLEDDATYHKTLELVTRAAGDAVVVRVRDNGIGIPVDAQEYIFDPFFTTKPVGEGTGLGLSISYGIVTEAGGEITCTSVEGEGTTFTMRFPKAA